MMIILRYFRFIKIDCQGGDSKDIVLFVGSRKAGCNSLRRLEYLYHPISMKAESEEKQE